MYFLGWIFADFSLGLVVRAAHDASSIPWSGPFAGVTKARWTLAVSLFVLVCFVGLAAANGEAWFPSAFWSVYSTLVAPRVVGVFSGFLIGAFLVQSIPFSNLVSGAPSLPWWGLPAGVVLLIIAVLLLLVRPDFLDSLQSFKAAGIEATFAARSSNLREVELNLNDVSQKLTLEDYQNFADDFIEGKSARGKVTAWFDKSPMKTERIEILKLIFNNYINPIVVSLSCLNISAVYRRIFGAAIAASASSDPSASCCD
jgi:competence protein ComGC